ncbi:MAG: carbohydrate-binding protein [Candidatus Scatovivens sp.]
MELTKEISYNKNLIQNEYFTLNYSGKLFKDNSQELFIVYGFDKDWKYTTEQKMEKKENGFSVQIQVKEFNEFNFCFKNSYNVWDNNNGLDYHLPISVQENIEINEELDKLLDTILYEVQSSKKVEAHKDDNFSQTVSYFEDLFDELFSQVKYNNSTEMTTEFDNFLNDLFSNDDSLSINNYTESITKQSEFAKEEEIEDNSYKQNLSLVKTDNKRKSIFEFENLSPFYVLKKRIRLAFYKLIYVLPSFLFGEEDDSEN